MFLYKKMGFKRCLFANFPNNNNNNNKHSLTHEPLSLATLPMVHRCCPSMVEPAKARGPERPRKTEAQKTAATATQIGGQSSVVVRLESAGELATCPKSESGLKNRTHSPVKKVSDLTPQSWASIVNRVGDNGG